MLNFKIANTPYVKFSKFITCTTWKVSHREQEEGEGQLAGDMNHNLKVTQLLVVPLLTRVQSHRF